jgi:hypothetical protein
MLPEAASERDQHSPHHDHCLTSYSSPLLHHCHPDTTHSPRSGTLDPFLRCVVGEQPSVYALTNKTGALHTTQIAHVTTWHPVIIDTTDPFPWRKQPPLFSVSRRSLTPDGPTPCLTLTHQTRQRISRHSLSPTSHDTLTSRGRPSVSPPS